MIVIATHAVFMNNRDIYGPPHAVSLFLNKKKINHIFIKHRLDIDGFSRVEYHKNGELINVVEQGCLKRKMFFLQYFYEMALTMKIVFKESEYCDTFIGVDCLNAFVGNVLKLLGKTKKTIYFSADFALKRFKNPVMNTLYNQLDKLAMFWSDQTWSVSRRIVAYRKKNGLSDKKNKIFPNAPFFDGVKRLPLEKINKHDLVIVSAISKGIAFDLLIDVLAEIKNKIKDVRLIVIGSGPEEKKVKEYVAKKKLQKEVVFLGALSHEKMFGVLVQCGIGIALYSDADPNHFRYFSDPMKVRDYLASGLPVIISGNAGIGTELEEKKVGVVVKLEKAIVMNALLKMIVNGKMYSQMRKNAISLAKEYDTYKLLDRYLLS